MTIKNEEMPSDIKIPKLEDNKNKVPEKPGIMDKLKSIIGNDRLFENYLNKGVEYIEYQEKEKAKADNEKPILENEVEEIMKEAENEVENSSKETSGILKKGIESLKSLGKNLGMDIKNDEIDQLDEEEEKNAKNTLDAIKEEEKIWEKMKQEAIIESTEGKEIKPVEALNIEDGALEAVSKKEENSEITSQENKIVSEDFSSKQQKILEGWKDNPYNHTPEEQSKFAWFEVYNELAEGDETKKQIDQLRQEWAKNENNKNGDYDPGSDQFKLKTGEAFKQIAENIKNDISAEKEEDVKEEEIVDEEDEEFKNEDIEKFKQERREGSSESTIEEGVVVKDNLISFDKEKEGREKQKLFDKPALKIMFKEAKNEMGNPNNYAEEKQDKYVWQSIYKKLDGNNDIIKKEVDKLRRTWAKADGKDVDYDEKSEDFKLQTGEALRQIVMEVKEASKTEENIEDAKAA